MRKLDNIQLIQEKQYEYPYHFIPQYDDIDFSQHQYWSTGYKYIGMLKLILDQLNKIDFKSIVDIGCGDGRFLNEFKKQYPEAEYLGIDYSEKAIALAKVMNHNSEDYIKCDILYENIGKRFDVVTLIETLEHIKPQDVNVFIENIVEKSLKDNGTFILTVPHKNKRLLQKHYQHFNSSDLNRILETYFNDIKFIPFDNIKSKRMKIANRIIGGNGSNYIITNKTLLRKHINLYLQKYLYTDEDKCGRIAVVCSNKKCK